ncbi:putative Zn-dependent peptidase [Deinobacterium chartae]|uniref:Putative Zn-dependent peptidase n=1 Tax=Deinobacterium chartae TaxID=521158 RepID=A0A841I303_9DEIO|nr:pitrilysin family protein [Deinobacterium chartae]MBB6098749.1 putative Zn-dependent peptidase [Deinobacterium chartae]
MQLKGGLTILAEPMTSPGAAFEFRIPCGSAADPAGLRGSASALEEWIYRGAGERDSRALADAFDALGLRRGGGAGHEATRLSASCLPGDLEDALALYADVLRRPRLEANELPPILDLARQDLEGLEDSPPDLLFTELRRRLFAPGYGDPVQGRLEDLASITPERLRADFARRYTPRGAVLGVAGDIDIERLRDTAQRLFGDWEGPESAVPPLELRPSFHGHVRQDSNQTHIALMYEGVHPRDPHWYLFNLAAGVLSGGSAARLFTEVREKRGLVYSVHASAAVVGDRGFLSAYAGTTPERAAETLEVLIQEIARLRQGVGADELERAKAGLLSSLVMSGESSRSRAAALTRDFALLGRVRSLEEVEQAIRRVSVNELNAYLEAYPLDRPAVLSLGPEALPEVVHA